MLQNPGAFTVFLVLSSILCLSDSLLPTLPPSPFFFRRRALLLYLPFRFLQRPYTTSKIRIIFLSFHFFSFYPPFPWFFTFLWSKSYTPHYFIFLAAHRMDSISQRQRMLVHPPVLPVPFPDVLKIGIFFRPFCRAAFPFPCFFPPPNIITWNFFLRPPRFSQPLQRTPHLSPAPWFDPSP